MASWIKDHRKDDQGERLIEAGLSCRSSSSSGNGVAFTHIPRPLVDRGLFRLSEARDGCKAHRGGSRIVALPPGRYQKPPQLAKGLKSCHLSHDTRDRDNVRAIDLELDIITHPKNTSAILPIIQARNSGRNTQLIHNAEMTWVEAKQGAKDCMILTTRWNLADGESKKKIAFPRAFEGDIQVLCWIKDFRFRTWCNTGSYTLNIKASNVKAKGFTAIAEGSKNAERMSTTWIVHRKGKPKVASGTFSTQDDDLPSSTGRVTFEEGTFSSTPTVLVALSGFDLVGGKDLRVGAHATNISAEGFNWHIDTGRDDSEEVLHSVEGTYVALGFV